MRGKQILIGLIVKRKIIVISSVVLILFVGYFTSKYDASTNNLTQESYIYSPIYVDHKALLANFNNIYNESKILNFTSIIKSDSNKELLEPSGYTFVLSRSSMIDELAKIEKTATLNSPIDRQKLISTTNFSNIINAAKAQQEDFVAQASKLLGGTNSLSVSNTVNVFNSITINGISESQANDIASSQSSVISVHPDYLVKANLDFSRDLVGAASVSNSIRDFNNKLLTGEGVVISIIDTGVDYTHASLGGCLGPNCKVIGGYDFYNSDSDPMDDNGHGTHVASTSSGVGINGKYIGIAPSSKVLAFKVLNEDGWGNMSDVISAIDRSIDPNFDGIIDDRADIINMSLGSSIASPDDLVSQAVDRATLLGVLSVVAAGNSGPNNSTIGSPGVAITALTVGATHKKNYSITDLNYNGVKDTVTKFSSRGPVVWYGVNIQKPDIVAPGSVICAAKASNLSFWLKDIEKDNLYFCPGASSNIFGLYGTSMATPVVAGSAALLLQKFSDWTPEQIKNALMATAKKLIDPGTNRAYDQNTQGSGRIDVLSAAKLSQRTPEVTLFLPAEITFNTSGKYVIQGSAYGEGFESYSVYYRDPKTSSEWNLIGTKNKEQISKLGELIEWNVTGKSVELNNKFIEIRLTLKTNSGNFNYQSGAKVINSKVIEPKLQKKIIEIDQNTVKFTENRIYNKTAKVIVRGIQSGQGFSSYSISYCKGYDCPKSQSSTQGVVLTDGGIVAKQVSSNLGAIDLSKIVITESGYFTVFVTTKYGTSTVINKSYFYVDPTISNGFPNRLIISPRKISSSIFNFQSPITPIIDDLNSDGKSEIVTVSRYTKTILISDSKGTVVKRITLPQFNGFGYSWLCLPFYDLQSYYFDTPVVTLDVNNDGNKDIIYYDGCNNIYAYNYNGSLINGYPTKINKNKEQYDRFGNLNYQPVSRQVVADIDNDNRNEIIMSYSPNSYGRGLITALNRSGTVKSNWPIRIEPTREGSWLSPLSNPLVAEINKETLGKEIIVAFNEYHPEIVKDKLIIRGIKSDGGELVGWKKDFDGYTVTSPMIAGDINNDGNNEVVFMASGKANNVTNPSEFVKIFALNGAGELIDGFPINIAAEYSKYKFGGHQANSGIVMAKLDDGSNIQLIATLNGCLSVFDINNGIPSQRFQRCPQNDNRTMTSQPIVGDIDGDGKQEIIVSECLWSGVSKPDGKDGYGYLCNDAGSQYDQNMFTSLIYGYKADGSVAAGFPKYLGSHTGTFSPSIGDLDLDGRIELYAYSISGNLFRWNLPTECTDKHILDWPIIGRDPSNSNVFSRDIGEGYCQ